jgi:hypothetical protein
VLGRSAEPSSDQQRAKLVTVQPGSVRLVVQAGSADMGGRGVIEEFFFDGIPVEPGDGTQASGDSGPGPAAGPPPSTTTDPTLDPAGCVRTASGSHAYADFIPDEDNVVVERVKAADGPGRAVR